MNLPEPNGPDPEPPVPEGLGAARQPGARSGAGVPSRPGDRVPSSNRQVPGPGGPGAKRSAEQIRADMDARRKDLSSSVDTLRDKVVEATDWRGQLRKHRKQILIGAVATGFVVGGLMALRRR